jgi:hypothetical protein
MQIFFNVGLRRDKIRGKFIFNEFKTKSPDERWSTAKNPTARILTAQIKFHLFRAVEKIFATV